MQLPWNDWEIGPNEIEVLQREDGADWKLGEGASGSVRGPRAAAPAPASTCCARRGGGNACAGAASLAGVSGSWEARKAGRGGC